MKRCLSLTTALICTVCFAQSQQIKSPSVLADGHSYVDLGLSVKWATCNPGSQSPMDYGKCYAWGEIDPKSDHSPQNYDYSFIENGTKDISGSHGNT